MVTQNLSFCYMPSPVGDLLIAGDGAHLHYISFPTGHKKMEPDASWTENAEPFGEVTRQLAAYFDGSLTEFTLPFALNGTGFQEQVWHLLETIPFGQTRTYGWMAEQLKDRNKSRAVGAANGANPLPIVLPCHRVIGADGSLTGFGGGVETKRWLLDHEGAGDGQLEMF